MSDSLSLSVFVIEVDWKPVIALAARKHADAETICRDAGIRDKLRSVYSGGKPICDDFGILRLRLAHSDERATYYNRVQSTEKALSMAYLVELDEDNATAPKPYPT